jgi:hypothetical protein
VIVALYDLRYVRDSLEMLLARPFLRHQCSSSLIIAGERRWSSVEVWPRRRGSGSLGAQAAPDGEVPSAPGVGRSTATPALASHPTSHHSVVANRAPRRCALPGVNALTAARSSRELSLQHQIRTEGRERVRPSHWIWPRVR